MLVEDAKCWKDLLRIDYKQRYCDSFCLGNLILKGIKSPIFRHIILLRISHESLLPETPWFKRILLKMGFFMYKRSSLRTGIQISPYCNIGGGLNIGHFGTIVVGSTTIGKNCTIFHGVTIGYAGRPGRGGTPIIGNNVVIGINATVVGPIKIGNNVFIGANAYVCKDVPDNAVVGAIPGNIISYKGTKGYFGN